MRPRTNQQYVHLAKDIAQEPYYRLLSKPYVFLAIVLLHIAIPFGFVFIFWQWAGVLALWITLVLIFNVGDGIDSFAHLYGDKPYNNDSEARNNKILALLTFGDGWHADHHQFPRSARLGFANKMDISWHILLFLQKIGLASELHEVSVEQINNQLKK
jgi:stearoyl-CoA desaturase (delta-9 desaturase)